jgi:hypothetical protein
MSTSELPKSPMHRRPTMLSPFSERNLRSRCRNRRYLEFEPINPIKTARDRLRQLTQRSSVSTYKKIRTVTKFCLRRGTRRHEKKMQQCVGYAFTRLPPIIKGVRFHLSYDFLKKLLENLNIITQMGRGKDLTEGERYTVKMLKKENKSAAEIGRILGRSPTSIKSCLKRLELTTDTAYLKRPNCGRKRIIDERTERRVLREIKTNPSLKKLPKRDLAKEISSGMPKTFSSATLVRTLKENGFKSRVARKKPFISEETV